MTNVLVYSTQSCPFCLMAFNLLDSKGIEYDVVDVGQKPELWAEMESKSGRQTVPQVFIGDHHVGGFDDLSRAERRGEIESLLKES